MKSRSRVITLAVALGPLAVLALLMWLIVAAIPAAQRAENAARNRSTQPSDR